MELNARIPSGPIEDKWDRRLFENKLVNPANKRKYDLIVVGTGLAFEFNVLAQTLDVLRRGVGDQVADQRWLQDLTRSEYLAGFFDGRAGDKRTAIRNGVDQSFVRQPGKHFAHTGAADLEQAGEPFLDELGRRR